MRCYDGTRDGRVKEFVREEIKNDDNVAAVNGIVKTEKVASEAQPELQQERAG
jgi:hypothetical protein